MRAARATWVTATLMATGCIGMRMDEGSAIRRASLDPEVQAQARARGVSPEQAAAEIVVVPMNAQVLMAQAKARAERREKMQSDPLADQVTRYEYRVAPFDVLSVIVWDHPELTIPAGEFRPPESTGNPVLTDGTMFFPHVGVVQVAGKTLPEVRELLTQRLARVIEKPQLDVRVAAFRGKKVQVTGEVMQPSTVPVYDVPLRALDAVNAVKGVTPDADLSRVVLTRDKVTHVLDLQAVNELGQLSQNWLLQDGDVLHVPDRRLYPVFVLGEVRRPSTKVMHKGRLSLADAISDAEGLQEATANAGRIYVIRGNFDAPQIYRLDASSPDALLLATQFQLEPRDVVFVSTVEIARWNRFISQLAPTVQMLWQGFDVTNRFFPGITQPGSTSTTTQTGTGQ